MNIKQNHPKAGFILIILIILGLAQSARAGDQVPYKGVELGTVTKGAFHFPFAEESQSGEGEATQVGHYTLTGNFVVDVRFGTATGVYTLTAANGDVLFLDMEGHGIQGDLTSTVAHFTITGGTGRFEGATGSFTAENHFEFAVNLPVSPNQFVAILTGSISTVGANRH